MKLKKKKLEKKKVILAHLSEQNNTEDLALKTLIDTLEKKKIKFENISVARQNEMSEVVEV